MHKQKENCIKAIEKKKNKYIANIMLETLIKNIDFLKNIFEGKILEKALGGQPRTSFFQSVIGKWTMALIVLYEENFNG